MKPSEAKPMVAFDVEKITANGRKITNLPSKKTGCVCASWLSSRQHRHAAAIIWVAASSRAYAAIFTVASGDDVN